MVFVGTVLEVNAENTTNSHPPKVKVKLEEILRGDLEPGATIETVWQPKPPPGCDTSNCFREWHVKPFDQQLPKLDSKLILFSNYGFTPSKPIIIWSWYTYVYSDATLGWIKNSLPVGNKTKRWSLEEMLAQVEKIGNEYDAWSESFQDVDVIELAESASIVGMAHVSRVYTDHSIFRFEIRLIKGELKEKSMNELYYVDVRIPDKKLWDFIERQISPASWDRKYILFINESQDLWGDGTLYDLVNAEHGILPGFGVTYVKLKRYFLNKQE